APRPRNGRDDVLELVTDPLDLVQVGSEDLDADGGPHSGREHVDAGLDRHGPGVRPAWELHLLVHLRGELFRGDPVLVRKEWTEWRLRPARPFRVEALVVDLAPF